MTDVYVDGIPNELFNYGVFMYFDCVELCYMKQVARFWRDNIPKNITTVATTFKMSGKQLLELPRLENLIINWFSINEWDLAKLTKLKSLELGWDNSIGNGGIETLDQLTRLQVNGNQNITDRGLVRLTRLQSLDLGTAKYVSDDGLSNLTNLRTLELGTNSAVTGTCFAKLTNLCHLGLGNGNIKIDKLYPLTNLKKLFLGGNDNIDYSDLQKLHQQKNVEIYTGTSYDQGTGYKRSIRLF